MENIENKAEYLIQTLEDNDVEYVFGYPGEQVLGIYEALRKSKIKHILMRHEQAAIHAADAYARVTGNYGVCLATAGPGAMNLTMGLAAAYKDSVPLIVLTGDVASDIKGQDAFQDIDINGVFNPITVKSYQCNSPEKLQNSIDEIFAYKEAGITGPFHINVSKNVQFMGRNVDHKIIKSRKIKQPQPSDINGIIKQINTSKRPLIIVGSGIIYADAIAQLNEFIDKTNIPITTTFHGRGIIPEDDPRNLGMIGNRGTKKSDMASENADLIIAMGCKLSERTTSTIKTDNIIQINTNKDHKRCEQFYQYNIKEVLIELNNKNVHKAPCEWIQKIAKVDENKQKTTCADTEKLNPEVVIRNTIQKADENTTITLDAGTTTTYFTMYTKLSKHSQLLFPGGFGPMGYSIPASIGAAFATDDVIFAAVGDGAMQMTMEELAVISKYKLPIIIFLINNSYLGIIKQWQDMANYENYEVELDYNPDFLKIAEAYNIEADDIKSIDELNEKVEIAIKKRQPHIFKIDVENMHIPMPSKKN